MNKALCPLSSLTVFPLEQESSQVQDSSDDKDPCSRSELMFLFFALWTTAVCGWTLSNGLQHRALMITNFLLKTLKRKQRSLICVLSGIGRTDLARSVTNVDRGWDKRLLRLINCINVNHLTSKCVMWETKLKIATLDCSKTFHLQVICKTPKSIPGGILCVFGSHTLLLIS